MTHIIVPSEHPAKYYGKRILLVLSFIILLFTAYEIGYHQSERDLLDAVGGRESVVRQLKISLNAMEKLKDQIVRLERDIQVEQETSAQLKISLEKSQDKTQEVKKELHFYKAIVDSTSKDTLYIQLAEFISSGKDRDYRYSIVIAQNAKNRSYTNGELKINLIGRQDGKNVAIPLESLTLKKDVNFKYRFKYYQKFTGDFSIPKGLEVKSVAITIDSSTEKETFALDDIVWKASGETRYVRQ